MGSKSLLAYLALTAVGFGVVSSQRGPLRPMLDECRALSTTLELSQLSTAMLLDSGMEASEFPAPAEFPRVLERATQSPRLAARDGWDRPYFYRRSARGFEIRSLGPDGKLGGGDDLATNWDMDEEPVGPGASTFGTGPSDAALRRCEWGSSQGVKMKTRRVAAVAGPGAAKHLGDGQPSGDWKRRLWDRLVKPSRPHPDAGGDAAPGSDAAAARGGSGAWSESRAPGAPRARNADLALQKKPARSATAPGKPMPCWIFN